MDNRPSNPNNLSRSAGLILRLAKAPLRPQFLNYGISGVLSVIGIAIALRAQLSGFGPLYFIPYVTTVFIVLVGGTGPGILAAAIGAFGLDYFVVDPGAFLESSSSLIRLAAYLVSTWIIGTAVAVLRSGYGEAERANIDLTNAIDSQKKTEEKLRKSEERFNLAVRGSRDGLWDWDLNTNDVFFSPRWKGMLGFEDHELPGRYEEWENRLHPDDKERVLNYLKAYFEGSKEVYEVDFRLQQKDGSYRWVLARGAVLRDSTGHPYRMSGTHTDISSSKYYEQNLKQALSDLSRSNHELEEFAWIASHDLREPLRTVGGYAGLLRKKYQGKIDSAADRYIAYITDGVDRMNALITDLLLYARVSQGEPPLEKVDVEKLFNQSLLSLGSIMRKTRARITHDPFPAVVGNPVQLGQVLVNLIGNAIKFHGKDPPEVHVSARILKDACEFSVKDNGIGIEPQYQKKIFQLFQRLHSRDKYEGTGIGLAVCKKIIDRHRGHIWVQSMPDVGSTFYFTIPLKQSQFAIAPGEAQKKTA